jgi:predicted acyl esterase
LVGSYLDSGTLRSAQRLFTPLSQNTTATETSYSGADRTKLTVGPWSHCGLSQSSPFSPDTFTCFDMYYDVLRFFDQHLRVPSVSHIPTGSNSLVHHAPVHYFEIGTEKWRAAQSWPLPVCSFTFIHPVVVQFPSRR